MSVVVSKRVERSMPKEGMTNSNERPNAAYMTGIEQHDNLVKKYWEGWTWRNWTSQYPLRTP